MSRSYFSEFILGQKCIPWFIHVKLRALRNFIREQHFVETIDLEKTFTNCLDGEETIEDIVRMKIDKYPDVLLKDCVNVKFLQNFNDKKHVSCNAIKQSEYYRFAKKYILNYGKFQGINDDATLMQYCRDLLNRYLILKEENKSTFRFITILLNYYKYGYPTVVKILNSDYFMIQDGHHRLSCQYVLNRRFVKARVVGTVKTHFQI